MLTPVPRSQIPKGTKPITTIWAMKKKPSGKLRGRLNARGYEQEEGKHYYADYIAAPLINPMSIRILLTLLAMNHDWVPKVIDIEGAFLQGRSKNGEELSIEIPEEFEQYYKGDVGLWLNFPSYGTKQTSA